MKLHQASSSISFLAFITICALSSSPLVNSQLDSCSTNLNLNGLSFDTTSFFCINAWNSYNYILRYKQSSMNVWSFVLSVPDANAYAGIGFSNDGLMVGSSAIVGWISNTDGTGVIKQYYLGGQTPSQVVEGQGNLAVGSSMVLSQSGLLYLAFQLNATQPSSRILYAIGSTGAIPPAPTYTLTQHRDKVSTTINYATGESASESTHTRLRRGHGLLNMIGWGTLLIIGAIVARYFRKWDPIWFYAHASIQSLGFVIGVIGIITGLILEDRLGVDVSTHKTLGIIILLLGSLQVMAFLARPGKTSGVRKYWNLYHANVGRALIAIAIGNIFYGIHLGNEGTEWNAGYGIDLAILFVTALILELRIWLK